MTLQIVVNLFNTNLLDVGSFRVNNKTIMKQRLDETLLNLRVQVLQTSQELA